MGEHNIQIKDLRPIGKKDSKICLICGCTGRDLKKYKTCEAMRDEFNRKMEERNI
jgi:hypothetical protein